MNEPNEPGAETARVNLPVLPEILVTAEAPAAIEPTPTEEPPAKEPSTKEPPIERRDPFAYMRGAPWMNRKLSPSGRAAILLRRDLDAFPVIEGRDPNHADLDAIVKRTVDYIVPIIRREQATDIVYDEVEKWRADRSAKAAAASVALPAAGNAATAATRAGASLLAAMPAGVLAPAALGAAIGLRPTTPDDGTFDLGEELRLRTPSGSLEGEIERRVGDRWESSGVRAALNSGLGARVLVDDVAGFANAVGADVAGRLADRGVVGGRAASAGVAKNIHDAIVRRRVDGVPAGPGGVEPPPGFLPIMEMRITSSVDGGKTITHAEIRDEDAKNFCPNYLEMQRIGMNAKATVDAAGMPMGRERGKAIHKLSETELKTAEVERQLRASGMQELHVEQGFLGGKPIGFMKSGGSRIDVVEKIGPDTVCVYDYKTGGATFPDPVRERYLKEAAWHFGAKTVYVLPIFVP